MALSPSRCDERLCRVQKTDRPVEGVSFALGYCQPTAFVQMFAGVLGTTRGMHKGVTAPELR
jgi:hypothetical protein